LRGKASAEVEPLSRRRPLRNAGVRGREAN
jgi:hypothetical protein